MEKANESPENPEWFKIWRQELMDFDWNNFEVREPNQEDGLIPYLPCA